MIVISSLLCILNDSQIVEPIQEEYEIIEEYEMSDDIDKHAFIISIMYVESRFNNKIVNNSTNAVGVLQIRKIYVDEVNRILKLQNINKQYSYDDRLSIIKSVEMFTILQNYHNTNFDKSLCLCLHYGNRSKAYSDSVYRVYDLIKETFILDKKNEINYDKSVLLSYIINS